MLNRSSGNDVIAPYAYIVSTSTNLYRIDAEILAEPAPQITWTCPDGRNVLEAAPDRASVDYEDGVATLSVKNISRSDAGNYHIVAKNTQVWMHKTQEN